MNTDDINSGDQTINVRGLHCPLPILRAKKALAVMQAGAVLTVLTTDHSAPDDFTAFCRQTGHQLLSCQELDKAEAQGDNAQAETVYQIVVKHR